MKFIKCPSLCLVIQSEVKRFKVFAEAASQGLLLFLTDLTLPPVSLVRNVENGFTGQYLPAKRVRRKMWIAPETHPVPCSSPAGSPRQHLRSMQTSYSLHCSLTLTDISAVFSIKITAILSDLSYPTYFSFPGTTRNYGFSTQGRNTSYKVDNRHQKNQTEFHSKICYLISMTWIQLHL